MTNEPCVLIVDDHPLFRDALETALQLAFPAGAHISQAASLAQANEQIAKQSFDLILLDLNMSDSSSFDGLRHIRTQIPQTPVFVVSATENSEAFRTAKHLGAKGYLPKSLALEELSAALVTALDGGTWFPEYDSASESTTSSIAEKISTLTPAQQKVISSLADGLLNKQIAYEMGISVATVKAHMTAIFRKLGANNRTQALLIYKQGLEL